MSKPVDKIAHDNVKFAIWQNDGPKGAFHTASLEFQYKGKDGAFHNSNSYGVKDLENLEKAAHDARERLLKFKNGNGGPQAA
jgi:hypothetical protein